jgi:hypothetical protein
MADHDPLCPWRKGDWPDNRNRCLCPEFSVVRQDEAIKATDKYRADLRAKVEALPPEQWKFDGDWVLRADVLALLDGSDS